MSFATPRFPWPTKAHAAGACIYPASQARFQTQRGADQVTVVCGGSYVCGEVLSRRATYIPRDQPLRDVPPG